MLNVLNQSGMESMMNPRTHMRLGAAATASISMALVLLIGGCSGSGPLESSAGTAGSTGLSVSTAPAESSVNTATGSSVSTAPTGSLMSTAPPGSLMSTGSAASSVTTKASGSSVSTGFTGMQPNVDASQRPGGDMVPHHVGPSGVVSNSPPTQLLPGATPNDIVSNRPSQGSAPQPPTPQNSASQQPTQHNATSDDAKNHKRRTR